MGYIEKAFDALNDAEFTLDLLEECEGDKRHFRILFVACMTLLKTVGQVLVSKNVDPQIKKISEDFFREQKNNKNEHKIYFEFIDRERGLIVHEYNTNLEENDIEIVYKNGVNYSTFNFGDLYRPLVNDNIFNGQDVRDLIKEAIEWWKVQLNSIKNKAEELQYKSKTSA